MTMLQHSFSKALLISLSLGCVGSAFAETTTATTSTAKELCTHKFEVLERTKKSFKFVEKELRNLNCEKKFEGKYFKIVVGTSEEAIPFNADADLIKKAANVYHHLTLARDYWSKSIKSEYVNSMDQLTIRLEITNAYSRTRHFKNEEQVENYNNAWSTPEGETPRFVKDKKYWGKEIWFSPKKIIKSREEITSKGNNPVYQNLEIVKGPVWEYSKNGLIYQGLSFTADTTVATSDFLSTAIQHVGILAFIYAATEITKNMDKFFINEFYYVDTAMVPEIIYHEFAHIALSDTMKTVHSVPVIEGVADYFAARIQSSDTLYEHLDGYSVNRTKKLKSKSFYHPYFEEGWNAEADFVLSVLWKTRMNFDIENEKRVKKGQKELVDFDQLVFKAHFRLTEESDIMNDLTESLLFGCHQVCDSKRYGFNVLHRSFEEKGFN